METRVFKNNNVRIRREAPHDQTHENLAELLEAINNDIDAPDVCEFGESYPVHSVTLFVNGAPRFYTCYSDMVGAYNSCKTVCFAYDCDAPLFTLPNYYAFDDFELDGKRGTLYRFCQKPSAEEWDGMLAAGCTRCVVSPEYAPEIVHMAAFVPDGTPFEFA